MSRHRRRLVKVWDALLVTFCIAATALMVVFPWWAAVP